MLPLVQGMPWSQWASVAVIVRGMAFEVPVQSEWQGRVCLLGGMVVLSIGKGVPNFPAENHSYRYCMVYVVLCALVACLVLTLEN